MATLYHFTMVDRNGRNYRGEPVTIEQEGLRRSSSHPVCMTPDPEEATIYIHRDIARARGVAILYAIDSDKVPEIQPGERIWHAEKVPPYAIKGEVVTQVNGLMTPRDIQWRTLRTAKRKGLI